MELPSPEMRKIAGGAGVEVNFSCAYVEFGSLLENQVKMSSRNKCGSVVEGPVMNQEVMV